MQVLLWFHLLCDLCCPQPSHVPAQTCSVLPLTSMFDEDKHAIKIISLFKDPLMNHAESRCSSGPGGLRVPIGLDDQRGRCIS